MHLIDRNIQQIIALCKKYKVKRLYAFGSILTPKFNDQSDIDLAVDFNDQEIPDMFEHFFDFIYELETLLGRKVDLVDQSAIRNSYFQKELNSTKKLIYG
ncbi:nucleotidyltransferase domain-containing protein [Parabacteroides distasonis]|nr:nucleotidyltransferase domain-containing protein [Parabacteroides distasonis]